MKITISTEKTIQKSSLEGYAYVQVAFKDVQQLAGKKCEIKGEIEVIEVKGSE